MKTSTLGLVLAASFGCGEPSRASIDLGSGARSDVALKADVVLDAHVASDDIEQREFPFTAWSAESRCRGTISGPRSELGFVKPLPGRSQSVSTRAQLEAEYGAVEGLFRVAQTTFPSADQPDRGTQVVYLREGESFRFTHVVWAPGADPIEDFENLWSALLDYRPITSEYRILTDGLESVMRGVEATALVEPFGSDDYIAVEVEIPADAFDTGYHEVAFVSRVQGGEGGVFRATHYRFQVFYGSYDGSSLSLPCPDSPLGEQPGDLEWELIAQTHPSQRRPLLFLGETDEDADPLHGRHRVGRSVEVLSSFVRMPVDRRRYAMVPFVDGKPLDEVIVFESGGDSNYQLLVDARRKIELELEPGPHEVVFGTWIDPLVWHHTPDGERVEGVTRSNSVAGSNELRLFVE